MRADQLLMGAVVAIGGFALFRMVTNKDPNANADGPAPSPSGENSLTLPSDNVSYLSDPLSLRQAGWYRGRLNVGGLPPFSTSADASQLAQALTLLGFTEVRVYMSPAELPDGWPKSTLRQGDDVRYFSGRWSQPSLKLPRPPAVELMWTSSQAANVSGAFDGVSIRPVTRIFG